jgi:hypothetical protein
MDRGYQSDSSLETIAVLLLMNTIERLGQFDATRIHFPKDSVGAKWESLVRRAYIEYTENHFDLQAREFQLRKP